MPFRHWCGTCRLAPMLTNTYTSSTTPMSSRWNSAILKGASSWWPMAFNDSSSYSHAYHHKKIQNTFPRRSHHTRCSVCHARGTSRAIQFKPLSWGRPTHVTSGPRKRKAPTLWRRAEEQQQQQRSVGD
eukprot:scaffold10_cov257-Pinguiococcus_pyrenoidosus.AAC.35